ncbi:MAG: hypothetical protein R3C53_16250 [Pirellulaceae bacterium]
MASLNELKAVHMPSEEQRIPLLVKYHGTLDYRICKVKSALIRAWFVNHGITIDTGEKAWNTGRTLINSYRKPLSDCNANELWRAELDIELAYSSMHSPLNTTWS